MVIEQDLLQKIYGRIHIDEDTLCFRYVGGNNGQDYGRMWAQGKNHSVHRVMYGIFHGPIPADKEVHHTCAVRRCCNVAHLTLVSHRDNIILIPQYARLRWERLQALVGTRLDLMHWGITHVTSTELWSLWGANCRGANLTKYLDTIAVVFPEAFSWSFVRPGRGRKPHLCEIRMSQELIDRLTADEEKTTSDVTMASPSEDRMPPMASLVLAV
jgi:hypothetical protein